MSIKKQINLIKAQIGKNVCLVAVSKTKTELKIKEAYDCGQRVFGENKVQELVSKQNNLPKDINWHMIGHLQRNKVKYIAPFISLIHGVDNIKLLKEIDKQARKNERIIDCLIQIKISNEDSKFGIDYKDANEWLKTELLLNFKNIRITGFMGMASNTNNELILSQEFSKLNNFFNMHKKTNFQTLSMGMSNDYLLAIKNGSNMVRVGSNIFGARK
ncbi:YggS family pyridoxal phosphate-dependent enzyme [Flavobacteriaceae bacterium]|nr:YggS family pyridoxal phosphate-dependent enzyme [Flavobacteriaceae bacterium]MDC1310371.1 YggS family pyridoxal phosphate-dependent enzyme [Flavobacteriaceae bacterium]